MKQSVNDQSINQLYCAVDSEAKGYVTKRDFFKLFKSRAILTSDSRLETVVAHLDTRRSDEKIVLDEFQSIVEGNIFFDRVVKDDLIIPRIDLFADKIKQIFDKACEDKSGETAQYIPQLAAVNPEQRAIAVCTIDGQRFSYGDAEIPYCVQSTCKPINYSIALKLNGPEEVHQRIGQEPSGRSFNAITLNGKGLPHNPMINAGAIMSCTLIKSERNMADRFEYVVNIWNALMGNCGEKKKGSLCVGFNNAVYHSERETADRNFALAHFMREVGAIPKNIDLHKTLDFYFQCCSIEITAEQQAIVCSSFANGGICPISQKRIFSTNTVKNCLSLMASCGMYDFSGEFAFSVGVPAKSGVSGSIMIVIPNMMGITIWSPRLDKIGNSIVGVNFCKELVKTFSFHNYDSLVSGSEKINPRQSKLEKINQTFALISAAHQGDLNEIRKLIAYGVDINQPDYDDRTALHLAAHNGHLNIVKYLINNGADKGVEDFCGNKPVDDAKKQKHNDIVEFLTPKRKKNRAQSSK